MNGVAEWSTPLHHADSMALRRTPRYSCEAPTRTLSIEGRSRMVEVARIELASLRIKMKASTCVSHFLISTGALQWEELRHCIPLEFHSVHRSRSGRSYPAIDVNPAPQDEPVGGLPYRGSATGRMGSATTCMVDRSSFTVAGTFTLSAFCVCQVF